VLKHCRTRLVVYLHNATKLPQLDKDCMHALVYGLQALGPANNATVELLAEVRMWPEDLTFDKFHTKWSNLVKLSKYTDLLDDAVYVVDQLKREGPAFDIVTSLQFRCSLYVVISSSGVLHHHNTGDSFVPLVYDEPVEPDEFQLFLDKWSGGQSEQDRKREGKVEKNKTEGKGATTAVPEALPTVLVAWDVIEHHQQGTLDDFFKQRAQDLYTTLQHDDLLQVHLVALIVSSETNDTLDGVIWEKTMDLNYFGITADKHVRFYFPAYRDRLKALVVGDLLAYEGLLHTLLRTPEIVKLVENGAIGNHVEAALDLGWTRHRCLGWSHSFRLDPDFKGGRQRTQDETFTFADECMLKFDDICPVVEAFKVLFDAKKKIKLLYFNPTDSQYPAFDMFVVQLVSEKVVRIHAIQVTVSDSLKHSVGTWEEQAQDGLRGHVGRTHQA
jgi:hypothetical protein